MKFWMPANGIALWLKPLIKKVSLALVSALYLSSPIALGESGTALGSGQTTIGGRIGDKTGEGFLSFIVPLKKDKNSLLFFNPRAALKDEGDAEGNLGLGYRTMIGNNKAIVGANVFYDRRRSVRDNMWSQWGVGLEILTRNVDARINYYDPDNKQVMTNEVQVQNESIDISRSSSSSTATSSNTATNLLAPTLTTQTLGTAFVGNNAVSNFVDTTATPVQQITTTTAVTTTTTTTTRTRTITDMFLEQREGGLKGFDAEVGLKLKLPDRMPETRIFAGVYDFENPFGQDISGVKARLEMRAGPYLTFDAEVFEDKELNGSEYFVGARLHIPFSAGKMWADKNPFKGRNISKSLKKFKERPLIARIDKDEIVRDVRIQTRESELEENLKRREVATEVEVDRQVSTSTRVSTAVRTSVNSVSANRTEALTNNGTAISIVHVDDNNAGDPGNSAAAVAGTYENPHTNAASTNANPVDANILLVHGGSTVSGVAINVDDNDNLLGEGGGVSHTIVTDQGSIVLPETAPGAGAGAVPILSGGGVAISSNNVLVDNFRIDNGGRVTTANAGTTHSNITLRRITVDGTGQPANTEGFNLGQGGILDGNIILDRINVTNTTGNGINVENLATTARFTGTDIIANNNLINGVRFFNTANGARVDVTNLTANGNTNNGLFVQNAAQGSIFQFNNFDAANSQNSGINLLNNSGQFDFDANSSLNSNQTNFFVEGGTPNTTFTGTLNNTAANTRSIDIKRTTGGAITFNSATPDAIQDNGTGIFLDNVDGTVNVFADTELRGIAGIDIAGGSGTFTFSDTDLTDIAGPGNPLAPAALSINSGNATINFGPQSSITQGANFGAVGVFNHFGAVTFDQATQINTTSGNGLRFDNADGTYNFNGGINLNGGDAGIDILNGSAGTFTFANPTINNTVNGVGINIDNAGAAATVTFNGLDVTTNNNTGVFIANNTGTVTIDNSVNGTSINSTGGPGFDATGATLDVVFDGLSATNGSGINLVNSTGTFTVGTAGGAPGSGGIINVNGGNAINITGGSVVAQFNSMNIDATGGVGVNINGGTTGDIIFQNSDIRQLGAGRLFGIDGSTAGNILFGAAGSLDATVANNTGGFISNTDANVTIANLNLANTGDNQGIDIFGGSGQFQFDNATITNATGAGIDVNNHNGLFRFRNGLIDGTGGNASTIGLDIDGGTGNVEIFRDIAPDANSFANLTDDAVNINNRSGTVLLSNIEVANILDRALENTNTGVVTITNGLTLLDLTLAGTASANFINQTGDVDIVGANFSNLIINGGNANYNVDAATQLINTTNAATVDIFNHITGTVEFDGTIDTNNGSGLQFDNADGIYNFDGSVTLNGGDAGIDILNGSAGTFTFANTDITNPTGTAINIDNSTAAVNFQAGSSVNHNSANPAVSITGHNTGGVTYSGTINASNGSGFQFNNADAAYNFDGNNTLNGGDAGIDILNGSEGTFTFADTDITNPTGTAINIDSSTARVDFLAGSSVNHNSANPAVSVTNHNTGAVTHSGTINATNGSGLQFDNADAVYNFNGSNTLNGGDAGIDILNGSAGTFTFADTDITNPAGTAINIDGSAAVVDFQAGSSVNQNTANRAVSITNNTGGTIGLVGAVNATAASTGIRIENNTGGTFNFTDANLGTAGSRLAADAVTIQNNTGGTTFIAALDTFNTTGSGLFANNNGAAATVGVTGGNIDSQNDTAIDITGTTLAAGGITFTNITSRDSAGAGINLDTVGGGPLSVTNTDIDNSALAGINLSNTTNTVNFNNVDIDTTGGNGVDIFNTATVNIGTGSNGLAIDDVVGDANAGIRINGMNGTINLGTGATPGAAALIGANTPVDGNGISILSDTTGTINIGNTTTQSSIAAGATNAVADGISSIGADATITVTGININQAGSGATGHGISLTDDNGVGTFTLTGTNTINNTGGDGVNIAGASASISNTTIGGTAAPGGDGIDITDFLQNISITLDNNTVVNSAGAGIKVDGSGAGSVTINSFNGNTVTDATLQGIDITDATFDATTGGLITQVAGGNTSVGTIGNRIEGDGIRLNNVLGDIAFGTVDVFNNNGTGLFVRDNAGKAGSFAISTTGGTIDTTNGTALDIDPVMADLNFAAALSTNATGQGSSAATAGGLFFDTVSSQGGAAANAVNITTVTVTAPGDDGISISNSAGNFSFGSVTIDNATGHGINLAGSNGNVTAATVDIDGSAMSAVNVANATNNVTINGGTIGSATPSTLSAVNIQDQVSGIVVINNLATTASNAGGVDLSNNAGTVTFTGGSLNQSGGFNGLDISGGAGTVNFGAAIVHTGAAGTAVEIDDTSGNVTVSGSVTNTNGGRLIDIGGTTGPTAGTVAFTGATLSDTAGTGIQIQNVSGAAAIDFSAGTTTTIQDSTVAGINLASNAGTVTFNGTTNVNDATGDGIEINGNTGAVSFGTTNINLGTADNLRGIDFTGSNVATTFGNTTITDIGNGGAANQVGIDFNGAALGGTVSFLSVALSGENTSTSSIGVDLTGVTGNQMAILGSQVTPATGPSSTITDLHRGIVIDNTASVQFTFGDGEAASDRGSSIDVNGQAGAFTVDLGGGTLLASSFNFLDLAVFAGVDIANLPLSPTAPVFVSETGATVAVGTHNLAVSTGVSIPTITVSAAEMAADTDQLFVFVAHDGTGIIDLTAAGVDGFTLDQGQSIDGFDDGNVISFGTIQPGNVSGDLGATGATVTQDSASLQNSNGAATSVVNVGVGNNMIANTVFSGTGLAAGDSVININGVTVNPVTLDNIEVTNAAAADAAVSITNNTANVTIMGSDFGGGVIVTGGAGIVTIGATMSNLIIDGGSANVNINGSTINNATNTSTVSVLNGHSGTVIFDAATSITATNGDGLQFNNAFGTYTFNGTTTLNGGDAGIDILNNTASLLTIGTYNFGAGTSITNPTGVAFNVDGETNNVTYSGSISQNNNAATVSVRNQTGAISNPTVFDASSTIVATNGTGLQFDNARRAYQFNGTTTLNGGDAGIDILNNVTGGTFTFGANTSITNPMGVAYFVQNSVVEGSFAGSIAQSNNFSSFQVDGSIGGNFNFTNASTINHTGNATAIAINNYGSAGPGLVIGGSVIANTGSATAVNITNSAGGISFTGGLDIDTTSGTGFNDTGPGTLNITGTNTINSTAGQAINLNGVTMGASGVTFDSITSTASVADGISLTGVSGGTLAVTGTTMITNPGSAGIDIEGTNTATFNFNDVVVDLQANNSTGFDLSAAVQNANFSIDDFELTTTGAPTGTTGINVVGTTGTGTVQVGDTVVGGANDANIVGVEDGVLFSSATNFNFVYGDGEGTTDIDSTINAGTPINDNGTGLPAAGSYNFLDVTLTGDITALAGPTFFVFDDIGTAGAGTFADPGTAVQAEAAAADALVVIDNTLGGTGGVSDVIDLIAQGNSTLNLDDGQVLIGLIANQAIDLTTLGVAAGGAPASFMLTGVGSTSTITAPGTGVDTMLPILSTGGANNTVELAGSAGIESTIINNTGTGDGIAGSFATDASVIINRSNITGGASAIDIDVTAMSTELALDTLTLRSAAGSAALDVDGSVGGTTTITNFNNLTVNGGVGSGAGVSLNTITFDTAPGDGDFTGDTVGGAANTLNIGQGGAGAVNGVGLQLTAVSGDLSFGSLNVTSTGTGLDIAGSGSFNAAAGSGFRLTTLAGTVNSTGASGVLFDPFTSAVTLSSVTSNGGTHGILLDEIDGVFQVMGATTINNATTAGVVIDNGSNALGVTATFNGLNIDTSGAGEGAGLVVTRAVTGITAVNSTSGTITTGDDAAIDIRNTGAGTLTLGSTLSSVTVSGATEGINLENTGGGTLNGSLNSGNGGSITSTTSRGVDLAGISASVTVGQTITNAAGRSIEVTGQTSGTNTFNDIINDTGLGMNFSGSTGGSTTLTGNVTLNSGTNTALTVVNNASHGVTFSGTNTDIDTTSANAVDVSGGGTLAFNSTGTNTINVTSGIGFQADGAGTVTVTGSSNLTTTTGIAVDIQNTTIGANDVTFESVSAGAGTNNNAITINNTGSTGGFHVTGVGSTNGSGGTIGNRTGADGSTTQGNAISLTNTSDVQIANMNLSGTYSNHAILGNTVSGLALTNVRVTGTSGTSVTADEGGVELNGITGILNVTNGTYGGGIEDNFAINNTSGSLTANFSGVSFTANNAASGDNGLQFVTSGSATGNLNVNSSTFTGGRSVMLFADIGGSGGGSVNIGNTSSNSFTQNQVGLVGGGAIEVLATGTGNNATINANIRNNNILAGTIGTNFFAGDTIVTGTGSGFSGTFNLTLDNNQIGTSGVEGSAAAVTPVGSSQGDSGIVISSNGDGIINALVNNNRIFDYNDNGLEIMYDAEGAAVPDVGGSVNLTITNNQISDAVGVSGLARGSIFVLGGGSSPGDEVDVCFDVRSNTLNNPAGREILLDILATGSSTYALPGLTAFTEADVASLLASNNSLVTADIDVFTSGLTFAGGVSCTQP